MTKYFNDKYPSGTIPFINRDIVTAGEEQWAQDPDDVEYSCKYCNRIMHKTKLIDSSGQNPSYGWSLYCSSCGISSQVEEDTRKKSKVKVHKGKITELAVSYAPEPGLKRKNKEPKGTFKKLQERGIKITDYHERGWRKHND